MLGVSILIPLRSTIGCEAVSKCCGWIISVVGYLSDQWQMLTYMLEIPWTLATLATSNLCRVHGDWLNVTFSNVTWVLQQKVFTYLYIHPLVSAYLSASNMLSLHLIFVIPLTDPWLNMSLTWLSLFYTHWYILFLSNFFSALYCLYYPNQEHMKEGASDSTWIWKSSIVCFRN